VIIGDNVGEQLTIILLCQKCFICKRVGEQLTMLCQKCFLFKGNPGIQKTDRVKSRITKEIIAY
jgi:hypothetical protein